MRHSSSNGIYHKPACTHSRDRSCNGGEGGHALPALLVATGTSDGSKSSYPGPPPRAEGGPGPAGPDWVHFELGPHGPPLQQHLQHMHAGPGASSTWNDGPETLDRSMEPRAPLGQLGLSAVRGLLGDRSDSPERGGQDVWGRRESNGGDSELCGMEVYSPLLSSLQSSLQKSLRRSITDAVFPASLDSGAPLLQSLPNHPPQAAAAAESTAAAAAAIAAAPLPLRPSSMPREGTPGKQGGQSAGRRRLPAPLQGAALGRLLEALSRDDFTCDTLLPVHIFLPPVRIAVRSAVSFTPVCATLAWSLKEHTSVLFLGVIISVCSGSVWHVRCYHPVIFPLVLMILDASACGACPFPCSVAFCQKRLDSKTCSHFLTCESALQRQRRSCLQIAGLGLPFAAPPIRNLNAPPHGSTVATHGSEIVPAPTPPPTDPVSHFTHFDPPSLGSSTSVFLSSSPDFYPRGTSPVTPTHELGRSGLALNFHVHPALLDSVHSAIFGASEEKGNGRGGDGAANGKARQRSCVRSHGPWQLFSHLKRSLSQSVMRPAGAGATERGRPRVRGGEPPRKGVERRARKPARDQQVTAEARATTSLGEEAKGPSQGADVSGRLPDRRFRLCM
jgi:hypothetical protein